MPQVGDLVDASNAGEVAVSVTVWNMATAALDAGDCPFQVRPLFHSLLPSFLRWLMRAGVLFWRMC